MFTFDTILPKYTPLFEDELQSKTTMDENISEFYPYAIYPNPTDGMVFVEYNFEYSEENGIEFLLDVLGKPHDENCNKGTLNLFSSDFKILHTIQLVQSAGMAVIDLGNYPAGTYIVEVLDCIGNTSRLKIVKY